MPKRILLVDDSAFMRMTIKRIMNEHGYTVVGEAENGKEGVAKYIELAPDLVTLDITMDEMSGIEALQEIISYNADAKVVMVSAMGQDAFIKDAISAGAKGFLVKPFKPASVISTISQLIGPA